MFGAVIVLTLIAVAIYYAKSGPQQSAFGMRIATGQIPDVFGVGRRALRRSTNRAARKGVA